MRRAAPAARPCRVPPAPVLRSRPAICPREPETTALRLENKLLSIDDRGHADHIRAGLRRCHATRLAALQLAGDDVTVEWRPTATAIDQYL